MPNVLDPDFINIMIQPFQYNSNTNNNNNTHTIPSLPDVPASCLPSFNEVYQNYMNRLLIHHML